MGKDKETRQRKQNPIAKDLPNFFPERPCL